MTAKILSLPTQAELKSLLWYEPESGIFRWRNPTNIPKTKPWDKAGCLDGKYVRITIGYTRYFAHRLAWVYMTGTEPVDQIDHIDRNKLNNSWSNLRQVTVKQNMENRGMCRNNTSGTVGVYKKGSRWEARIKNNGKQYSSGRLDTAEQAAAWRQQMVNKLFTHQSKQEE